MKAPSAKALLDVLREYGKAAPRRPAGDGWKTVHELAAEGNTTPDTIKYQLKMARRRGVKVDMAAGTAVDAEGRMVNAAYYRLREMP